MDMEGSIPKIYTAIASVIADVGAVAKDKINKQQGFKYRSVDDVFNALHPALAKNKVFIVPRILEQTREVVGTTKNGAKMTLVICKISFTFYAEDGSSVEAIITGEGLDTGDKATNKAMAIAYKYACFQVFCIPTEEMTDPDSERPELDERNDPAGGKVKPPRKQPSTDTKADKGQGPDNKEQPSGQEIPEKIVPGQDDTVTPEMIQAIDAELVRTGVTVDTILKLFKVESLDKLTGGNYEKLMKKFQATPDLKKGGQDE